MAQEKQSGLLIWIIKIMLQILFLYHSLGLGLPRLIYASLNSYSNQRTVYSIFAPQNGLSFMSVATWYSKLRQMTGIELQSPAGIPYSPLLITPIDTILSVPRYQSRRWSIVAQAAENTELPPRTFKIQPPLFCTRGINSVFSHSSPTVSLTFFPLALMWWMQGYWVVEWFPKMTTPSTYDPSQFVFQAIWLIALLWSSLVKQVILFGRNFEQWANIVALVLAGFATTTHFTVGLAYSRAWACSTKMLLFFWRRSFLSMPFFLGNPPRKTITSAFLNISLGRSPYSMLAQRGNAQSLTSMATPLSTLRAGVMSRSLRLILQFGNALPLRSWGIKEQAICPAAPVTHTVISLLGAWLMGAKLQV